MYESDDCLYCYPKSEVLKNRFNVRDSIKLEEIEREYSEFKMIILESFILENNLNQLINYNDINDVLIRNLHKFMFEDIYYWAGNYRKVRITKGSTVFCYPENIQSELIKVIKQLKMDNYLVGLSEELFSERISYYISKFNMIYPFREGNGRVLRILSNIIALKSNFYINYSFINIDNYLDAMIKSVYNTSQLKALITKSLLIHKHKN